MEQAGEDRSGVWHVGVAVLLAALVAPAAYRVTRPTSSATQEGQIVLRYMPWGQPQQYAVEREIIQRFNEKCAREGKPVRVELFVTPAAGYPQKTRLMLASDAAPDVIRVDHYEFASLVMRGYFRDLTEYAADDQRQGTFDPSDYHELVMRENKYQGRLYAMNVLFGAAHLYYNKDLFAQSLLPEPYELWKRGEWTWAKFEEVARALTVKDEKGRVKQYGFILPGWGQASVANWSWFIWAWSEGGDLLSEDRTRSLLDTPQVMRAFGRYRAMRYEWNVAPTPADIQAAAFSFESGNVAMEIGYLNNAVRYRDSVKDFDWDIAPTPSISRQKHVQLVKGNQLVVTRTCKHPREAWEWVKFLTSREVEQILCGDQLRRCLPTRKSVLRDPAYLKASRPPFNMDIFAWALDHGRELPIDGTWPAWTAEMQKYVDMLFTDENSSVEKVLPMAKDAVDKVLEREHRRMARYRGRSEGRDAN